MGVGAVRAGVITLTTADHPVPGCYFMVSAAKYSPLSKI